MREIVFHSIGIVVTAFNLWTFSAWWRMARRAWPNTRKHRLLLLALPFAIGLTPGLCLGTMGSAGADAYYILPVPLTIATMTTQLALWLSAFVFIAAALLRILLRFRKPKPDLARPDKRRFLGQTVAVFPAIIIAASAGGAVGALVPPTVTRIPLRTRREHSGLRGVTIAQISDIHIGSNMPRERLGEIATAVNWLRPDYVVVTGDLVDRHPDELNDAVWMLQRLRPKRQTLLCMGNHEYIAARDESEKVVIEALGSVANLMIDRGESFSHAGSKLWIGGIDYPRRATEERPRKDPATMIAQTVEDFRDDGAPRVILAHHPKSFHDGREFPIDLMLSGHFHGGQLSLGRIGQFALTPILPFEFYHQGHYDHEGRQLYVNAGCGGWLPVRFQCPPEITLVTLV